MGSVTSALWGFVWQSEDAINDGVKGVIDGDENLSSARDTMKPIYEEAKDIKKTWQWLEEAQEGKDKRDQKGGGIDNILERAEDLGEDFLIEAANDLGFIDMIDGLANGFEHPEQLEYTMEVMIGGRWIFNFFFIAWPWWGWSMVMLIYNIVFNAWLNKGWAEGNLYLMANTIFCITQWMNSVAIAFEFPFYMRSFKILRWISFQLAVLYNNIYFFALGFWLWTLYYMTEKELEEVGAFDILLNMFFIYNCILHSSTVVINLGIIFKEFNVEFYQMFVKHGGEGSDYNLAANRVIEDIEEELWYMDPVRLFKGMFQFFMGETVTEEIQQHDGMDHPWYAVMNELGEYADHGAPSDYHFDFEPYNYADKELSRYISN